MMHTPNIQSETTMPERRTVQRQRVLKSGVITPDDNLTVLDCVARNLSDNGVRVDVAASFIVPKESIFKIRDSDFARKARVVWRSEKSVGLEFTAE